MTASDCLGWADVYIQCPANQQPTLHMKSCLVMLREAQHHGAYHNNEHQGINYSMHVVDIKASITACM
jgi:hypothetical protein